MAAPFCEPSMDWPVRDLRSVRRMLSINDAYYSVIYTAIFIAHEYINAMGMTASDEYIDCAAFVIAQKNAEDVYELGISEILRDNIPWECCDRERLVAIEKSIIINTKRLAAPTVSDFLKEEYADKMFNHFKRCPEFIFCRPSVAAAVFEELVERGESI